MRADPRASRSMPAASGKAAPVGGGEDELGHGVGRAGPAQRPRRGRHPGVCQRVVEQLRRVEQGVGVERLVVDQPGGSGLDQARRVRALVAGGVRVGHDDHRHAEGGHLGQRRGPGPADDEVGGGQRGEHLVAQERVRPVAPPDRLGQALATGQRGRVALVAGDVDDGHPLDQPRQGLGDRRVEAPDGLRPAEDEQDPLARARRPSGPGRPRGRSPTRRGSACR